MKLKLIIFTVFFFTISIAAQDKIEVFFDFNKSNLNSNAINILDDWILNNTNSKLVKISGFCDWKGTNSYNDSLAKQRVQSVLDYLNESNTEMELNNFNTQIIGENFTQNKTQALNRKVEILYTIQVLEIVEEKKVKKENDIPEIRKEPTLSEQMNTAQIGDKIKLKSINFFNNSAQIVPKSTKVVFELLAVLKETPNLKIEIQGHICCQSSNKNDRIATERALAIYNFLKRNGIKSNRISYKGFGTTQPLYSIPEKNDFERNENRRVEIKIIKN